jgi:hypothetical protein
MNLKLPVTSRTSVPCVVASVILRTVTSLELNVTMYEKGDLMADSCRILARWRKYFSQVLNEHGFSDIRQTEIYWQRSY